MALARSTVNRAPSKDMKEGGKVKRRKLDEPMDDVTLRNIVKEEIHTAVGYIGGDVSEDRRRSMNYYLGDPFGNEIEGSSQVVSTDVQDTVESIMPDLMEIFAAGDEVVRYEPSGPEDEPFTQQATDYANHIWSKDNDGFGITHDWIKDALLQKNGIIKTYWDDSEKATRETLENVNSLKLQELLDDSDIEIIEHETRPVEDAEVVPFAPDGELHDLTLLRSEQGRIQIDPVPPEEFLIARRSVSLPKAEFTCHKTKKTVSDLIQMGYNRDEIEKIPSHDDQDYNEERVARFDDDEWPELDDSLDPAMREIWLYECYIKVDYDGDGVTEMRQVTVAGPGYGLLDNVPKDDHPFSSVTPIRMPHKFFGRSLADLVEDIQLIKSTIQRQLLDNMYNVNNARAAISNKVDLDDFLSNRPGGAIRVDVDEGTVGGHIESVTTQSLGSFSFPLLEYMDSKREVRTGITRMSQGLDPDSLNKTASGINQLLGQQQKRFLLIARVMAETGFKDAFRKILKLIVNHQDRPRTIRLRNEWVPMDPRSWNADMNATTSVGLGTGTKQQQTLFFTNLLGIQERIIERQGGADGPLVGLENIHNTVKRLLQAGGQQDTELFISDPGDEGFQPIEPPPDPAMVKAQIDAQAKGQEVQAKLQVEQAKLQVEQAKLVEDRRQFDETKELDRAKLEADTQIALRELELKREKQDGEQEALVYDRFEAEKTATFERAPAEQVENERKMAMDALAEQIAALSRQISSPKVVEIKKGRDGKIAGATITQGGAPTEVQTK